MAQGDLSNVNAIYAKGFLFLLLGTIAATILVVHHPSLQFVVLLAIAIWSFSRAYYCAFYVIEHYVDSQFKFSGLLDFARYLAGKPRR